MPSLTVGKKLEGDGYGVRDGLLAKRWGDYYIPATVPVSDSLQTIPSCLNTTSQ